MDTYFNYAYFISLCLFPIWWGIGIFAFRKIDNYMSSYESDFYPIDALMGAMLGVLITIAIPLLPFVLAFAVVGGGPAWLVYKSLTWASQNLEIKFGKEE